MFYVLDENNNKSEAYDKEEVLAILEQAIADGSLANLVENAAFISKLKCCVSGQTNKVAFVTTDKYNELVASGNVKENTYYFITDDCTTDDINKAYEEAKQLVDALTKEMVMLKSRLNGGVEVRTELYNGSADDNTEIALNSTVAVGDILEVQAYVGGQVIEQKFRVESITGGVFAYMSTTRLCTSESTMGHLFYGLPLSMKDSQTVSVGSGRTLKIATNGEVTTTQSWAKVYKISKVELC